MPSWQSVEIVSTLIEPIRLYPTTKEITVDRLFGRKPFGGIFRLSGKFAVQPTILTSYVELCEMPFGRLIQRYNNVSESLHLA
jgi:hypothetical protein